MTDIMSKEERSKLMSKIKSISALEDTFASALWVNGARFRRNVRSLKGTPDIAIKKYKIVIFIDSCYWHACPEHLRIPKSNVEFWEKKFEGNKRRDFEVTTYYLSKGWNIKRIWEHEIKADFDEAINNTLSFINKAKKSNRLRD